MLKNILAVGLLTLVIKIISFFKEIVIANNLGLSELLDTFFIAFLIPSFISNVFLDAFKSVFIPNYVNESRTSQNIGGFQSASFLVTLGSSLFFILIAILFTDVYLETFFKGHTASYYELVKTQFYYVMPCILFWGLSSLLSGLLTIDDEFTFSSLNTIFTPISIIISLLFFKEELGTLVLAVGTLIGSILNFIFLLVVSLQRGIIKLQTPNFVSPNIKTLFNQIPAKLSAGLLSGINPIVDQYFSAQLIVGSIAALNFGLKIPAFSIGILGIALGNVLLPYFSKSALEDRYGTFIKLKQMLKNIVIGSSIIVAVLILFSHPIIRLLFERNAFTSESTEIVSKIQQMYLLQIPSYISGLIMIKFLTAINKNRFLVITSIISLLLNIFLNYILIDLMGVYGLALATSIVSVTNSIILYIYITKLIEPNV